MTNERWALVAFGDGRYEVSNRGNVRKFGRIEVRLAFNRDDYVNVKLHFRGESKTQ